MKTGYLKHTAQPAGYWRGWIPSLLGTSIALGLSQELSWYLLFWGGLECLRFFFSRWFYWSDTLLGSSAGLRVSLNSWQLTQFMYTPGLSDLVSLVSFRDFLKPLHSLLPKGSKLLWGIECFHFLIKIFLLKSFSSRWRFYFRENLYKTSPLLCSLQLTSPRHSTMSISLIISCPLFVFLSQWVWLCTWL